MKPIDRAEVVNRIAAVKWVNPYEMSRDQAVEVALALLSEARASERADAVKGMHALRCTCGMPLPGHRLDIDPRCIAARQEAAE